MQLKTKLSRAPIGNSGAMHILPILLIVLVIGVGFAGWRVMSSQKDKDAGSNSTASDSSSESTPEELVWQQTEAGWKAMGTAPECPDQPMLKMPADISKVTSVLYPGQPRGGNYKPHGGFRFDNSANADIKITAPIDGFIVRGGHYMAEGEIQYTFDVMNNCGVMYRFGHLRELPEDLMKLTTSWPAANEGSATHAVSPAVYVKQGHAFGTSVGIIGNENTFFDWGVYDYRQQNEASKSAAYQQAHAQEKELAWHAVCWLEGWLPASDEATLAKLEAGDPTSAKNSDYCG